MIFEVGPKNCKKEIEIKLPDSPSRIGVLVSGGADSAILLFILAMLNIKKHENRHEIISFTVPREDGAYLYSPDIVRYVNEKLGTTVNIPHKVGDPTLHHSKQVRSGHLQAVEKFNLDFIYYGSQSVPPSEFKMSGIYPARPEKTEYGTAICPFALVDKRHTLDLYVKLDQFELLKLTHSCTEQKIGRCGKCFNCVEREWACAQLGIKDPGMM